MTTELVIWSPACGRNVNCPPGETTWLGRWLLSAGEDRRLHRRDTCAGVRYIDHQWELINRDTRHEVYLAPRHPRTAVSAQIAQATAEHMLPVATPRLEPYPIRLDQGEWLIAIDRWFLVLFVGVPAHHDLDTSAGRHAQAGPPAGDGDDPGRPTETTVKTDGEPPVADAVSRVRAYFDKRGPVHMAIAYYYQEYILGKVAPQEVPMIDVAVALNLTNQSVIADYKKELQKLIWDQTAGHQRDLAEFLITTGLIDHVVLQRARQLAEANEKTGKASDARQRFGYRPRRPGDQLSSS